MRAAVAEPQFLGLDIPRLLAVAHQLQLHPVTAKSSDAWVEIVFDFQLVPGADPAGKPPN